MPVSETAREILDWTQRVIDTCGPRPAGSASCLKSAELIAQELEGVCDRAALHHFECRPHAFIAFGAIAAGVMVVAAGLLFAGSIAAAAVVYWAVALVSLLQFGLYVELVDRFFPRAKCANAVGIIEPKGAVLRQIVVSGHHDTAYEFRYLRVSKVLYALVGAWHTFASFAMPLGLAGLLAAMVGWGFAPGAGLLRGLAIFSAVPALIFTTFFTTRSVPGAGDNLVSSGIALHAARTFRERLRADAGALRGTRLIFVSFDAEEAGLRGSRAFIRDYQELLGAAPVTHLNLESFYTLKSLSVITRDLNGFVPLSRKLADLWIEEGQVLGLKIAELKLIYGLGATDAAEFARGGMAATTLLAVPHDFFSSEKIVYHTREDTPDNLEPEVIDAATTLTLRMIERLVREGVADPAEPTLRPHAPAG